MGRLSSTPRLLIELEPAHKIFAGNLREFLFPKRPPALLLSSRPGVFWPDVFVASRPPWQIFAKSMLAQAVLGLGLLAAFKFAPPPHVLEQSPFRDASVIYFKASEYLPPIDTVKESSIAPQQGAPQPSKQTIISVPPEANNRTQTVVTAPALRLSHQVPLPNMVSWAPKPPVIPAAMTEREISGLKARTLTPSAIVTPVTGPAPELSKTMQERTSLLPASAVVAPAPEMNRISERKPAEALATETNVVAPTPLLNGSERSPRARLAASEGNSVAPPAPSLSGPQDQARKLIVLNASPVPPPAEDKVQIGNRRGTFAATPQGKSGSPGSPSTAGRGEVSNSSTTDSRSDIPAGLLVGAAPKPDSSSAGMKDKAVVAEVIPPRVTSTPQESASAIPGRNPGQVEKTIFGDRRFYSMTMNMPNLNSAGGSWVIRFAELKQNQNVGALVAPVATQEVDPGYPAELMRHNISGTVTLYAVIRRDGSVGEVRILVSADDRLDEYARNALLRWRFQPATKNGSAVDLEAIVIIPFKPARMKSAF